MIEFGKDLRTLLLLFSILLVILVIPYVLFFKPAIEGASESRQLAILQQLSGNLELGDARDGEGNIITWWPINGGSSNTGKLFIVRVRAEGYRAPLDMFAVISETRQVIQVIIADSWEISMYDDMLHNNDFLRMVSRVKDRKAPEVVSGATYSAMAIVSALNKVREYVETMLEG